jgi:hemerythrin-like domain-containing protein
MSKALDIIRNEHRSIAVVLENLRRLARAGNVPKVNAAVFGAMVNYLEHFANLVHHPKEDEYLFAPLLRRSDQAEALIAGLEREHAEGDRALHGLKASYARLEAAGDAGLPAFARSVEDFARAYYEHMRKEEEQLFPLAEKLLTPEDWSALDRAFEENRDPIATGELKAK